MTTDEPPFERIPREPRSFFSHATMSHFEVMVRTTARRSGVEQMHGTFPEPGQFPELDRDPTSFEQFERACLLLFSEALSADEAGFQPRSPSLWRRLRWAFIDWQTDRDRADFVRDLLAEKTEDTP